MATFLKSAQKSIRKSTRKSTHVWLIKQPISEIKGNKLPSKRQTMELFFHLHLTEKKSIRESATEAAKCVKDFWDRARIPTRRDQHIVKAIEKIFQQWQKLKRSQIKIPEDKEFLIAQREDKRRGVMAGIDRVLASKESKSATRLQTAQKRKEQEACQREKRKTLVHLVSSSSSDESEDEAATSVIFSKRRCVKTHEPPSKRAKKTIMTPALASALDRTKVSDRKATMVLISAAKSLGHDVSELNINRSSIRRCRIKHRRDMADEIMATFNPSVSLMVHWDGKLLPDITGKEVVDRLPILVTGDGLQQLLGVPKLSSGSGLAMATATTEYLEQWGLTEKVKSMCFDTTASNTGEHNGACVFIERILKKDLLHFACRHHVFEIVLESVVNVFDTIPQS